MRLGRLAVAAICVCAFTASIERAVAQSLLRDAEIEQWIKDYSYPIFKIAGIEPASVNILLVGDQSINAFAGGLNMGIHTGLLSNADTPNQVLGVIAHETGHIAGGHSQRSSDAMARASTPILLSLVLAAGAIAAGAPEAGIGILGLGQNIAIGEYLTYSRGQEATADQAALTYLEATGQSGRGLVEFFGKLRNEQIIRGYKLNPYLQSHPLANDRIAALEERAKASQYYGKTDTPEEIARLHLIRGKIRGFMQEPNVTLRQYPLSDQSDEADYARAVAYYRSADIDKGLKEIDGLIAKKPGDPYFYELKGQMLFEFGRVAESVDPHRRSIELAPDKALLKINYGRALSATEDPEMLRLAVKELKAALAIENDNAFGWFELARAYGGLGEEALANLATAESRYHSGQRAEAGQFARRAQEGLVKNTPEWRRANDILLAVAPDGPETRPKRRDDETPPPRPRPKDDVPDPQ